MTYDLFLSFNSKERSAAIKLADDLRAEGLSVFVDETSLPVGQTYHEELAVAIGGCHSFAALVGASGLGNWQRLEIGLAIDRLAHDPSFVAFHVLLPGLAEPVERGALSPYLRDRTWVDLRDGEGVSTLLAAITTPTRLGRVAEDGDTPPTRDVEPALRTAEQSTALPPTLTARARSALRGRSVELAQLSDAIAGPTPVVLIEGTAGIGKSRLLEEAARSLTDSGQKVLHGWTHAGSPPFTLWRTALSIDGLDEGGPPTQLFDDDVGFGVTNRRGRLFDRVRRGLAAAEHPPVIFLDDVHWADDDSIDLLSYLSVVVQVPAQAIVLSARSDELGAGSQLGGLLARLERDGRLARVALQALSDDETAIVIKDVATAELQPVEIDRLVSLSAGSPLFAVELARHACSQSGDGPTIPTSLGGLFDQQCSAMSSDALDLLEYAAVIGGQWTVAALLADHSPQALDECLEARVIAEVPGDNAAFTHPLWREHLLSTLTPGRRRTLHQRAAEALAPSSKIDDLDARAHHLDKALPVVEIDRVIAAHVEAANAVERRNAFDRSVALLQRAIELAAGSPATTGLQSDLYVRLGRTLTHLDDLSSDQILHTAARLKLEEDDIGGFVEAVRSRISRSIVPNPDFVLMLDDILTTREDLTPDQRSTVLSRLALDIAETQPERSADFAAEAWELAEAHRDVGCMAAALRATVIGNYARVRPETRSTELTQLASLAHETHDDALSVLAMLHLALDDLALGEIDKAERTISEIAVSANRLAWPRCHMYVHALTASLAQMTGDPSRFEQEMEQIGRLGARSGLDEATGTYAAIVAAAALHSGGLGQLADTIGQVRASGPRVVAFDCAHAAALSHAGRTEESLVLLDAIAVNDFREASAGMLHLGALVFAAEATISTAAVQHAPALLSRLEVHEGLQVVPGAGLGYLGPVDAVRGRLATLIGDQSNAGKWLTQAQTQLLKITTDSPVLQRVQEERMNLELL